MGNKHWLWYAYLALSDRGGMTEEQGRKLLKETFPNFADAVDPVVANFGRKEGLSEKLNEDSDRVAEDAEKGMSSLDMNERIRQGLGQRERPGNQDREANGAFSSGRADTDMNRLIREAANKGRKTVRNGGDEL